MKIKIGLEELERLLQAPPPKGYVAWVKGSKPAYQKKRGFDPKTLCILNLALREGDREGWTKDRFFLSGDGCGNYYFVANGADDDSEKVLLWAHDPLGIEDPELSLTAFLTFETQMDPIIDPGSEGSFCIARTDVAVESILDPILLKEWKKAISACDNVRYQGYLVGRNPVTGERLRCARPGRAVASCDGKEVVVQLTCGRVVGAYTPRMRPIVEKLAKALRARLNIGSD